LSLGHDQRGLHHHKHYGTRRDYCGTERFYRLLKTCDQIAIMPTNSVSDASAAASWITALNIAFSPERTGNIVHGMFQVNRYLNTGDRELFRNLINRLVVGHMGC